MFILELSSGEVDGQWDGKGREMTVLSISFLVSTGSSTPKGVQVWLVEGKLAQWAKLCFYSLPTFEIENIKTT